VGKATKQSEAR